MTARNLRIADRGFLRVGAMADVVVFDPADRRAVVDAARKAVELAGGTPQ